MRSPSKIAGDVLESFPDGSPKSVHFHPYDLDWIKEQAKEEWIHLSQPFQLKDGEPMDAEEFRVYCIAFATMRWLHAAGILKEGANVQFQRVWPDSTPMAEDHDWVEPPQEET